MVQAEVCLIKCAAEKFNAERIRIIADGSPDDAGFEPGGDHRESELIWPPIWVNMGSHIMKTTIEIADDLFERAQRLARKQRTTLRALTEEGLRLVLAAKNQNRPKKLPPLVTFGGEGPTDEFKDWNWDQIRTEIYRGRGG